MSQGSFSPATSPQSFIPSFDKAKAHVPSKQEQAELPDSVNNWNTPVEVRNAFIEKFWAP